LAMPPRCAELSLSYVQARYAGVFAPGSNCRSDIIPAAPADTEPSGLPSDPPTVRPRRLPWAQLLKRVLNIDVLACPCGGRREIIAFVTDPAVINKILLHLHLPSAPPRSCLPAHPRRRLSWSFTPDLASRVALWRLGTRPPQSPFLSPRTT
jgi:hypothetical protein